MSKNGLLYPRCQVMMQDGSVWEVQPIGPDALDYDMIAAKRKWPPFNEIQTTWATYLAWHASKREGLTTLTWDQFREQHTQVKPIQTDDADEDVPATDAATFPAGEPDAAVG